MILFPRSSERLLHILNLFPLPRPYIYIYKSNSCFTLLQTTQTLVHTHYPIPTRHCFQRVYIHILENPNHLIFSQPFSFSFCRLPEKTHYLILSVSCKSWSLISLPSQYLLLARHKPPLDHCPVYATRNQEIRRSWFMNKKIVIHEDHEPNSQSYWFGTWVWLLLSLRVLGYCICGFTESLVYNVCSTLFLNF